MSSDMGENIWMSTTDNSTLGYTQSFCFGMWYVYILGHSLSGIIINALKSFSLQKYLKNMGN